MTKIFFKPILIVFYAVSIITISCDKDYLEIDSGIIGDPNYELVREDFSVRAYNQSTGFVQSNNVEIVPFGIYNLPNFGKVTAHYVTQLTLPNNVQSLFTTTHQTPEIKKIELYIPYFQKSTGESDGEKLYELDSIYGTLSKMKLNIFENGILLRDLQPPLFLDPQKYFSNQFPEFFQQRRGTDASGNSVVAGIRLNNKNEVSQNEEFEFSNKEIKIVEMVDDEEKIQTKPPGIYLELDVAFFQKKIIDGFINGQLINSSVFNNHFRGLLFQLEQSNAESNPNHLNMINFRAGKITVTYDDWGLVIGSDPAEYEKRERTFDISLTGNNAVFFENSNNNSNYLNAIQNPNQDDGDATLYLRGGHGSFAFVDLFDKDSNGVSSQLENLRNLYNQKKILINNATITFYIDKDVMSDNIEPQRLLLYNIENKSSLIDFVIDASLNQAKPKLSKFVYGGILSKQGGSRGVFYRFNITNHVTDLITNSQMQNHQLALTLSENIANNLLVSFENSNQKSNLHKGNVVSPLGTVLFGNNTSNQEKKIKFEIIYSKL